LGNIIGRTVPNLVLLELSYQPWFSFRLYQKFIRFKPCFIEFCIENGIFLLLRLSVPVGSPTRQAAPARSGDLAGTEKLYVSSLVLMELSYQQVAGT